MTRPSEKCTTRDKPVCQTKQVKNKNTGDLKCASATRVGKSIAQVHLGWHSASLILVLFGMYQFFISQHRV